MTVRTGGLRGAQTPDHDRELCITDEHYDPTVLAFYGVGSETTCNPNSLVEVNWRQYDWEKVCGAL
jgi:hypothetical protein